MLSRLQIIKPKWSEQVYCYLVLNFTAEFPGAVSASIFHCKKLVQTYTFRQTWTVKALKILVLICCPCIMLAPPTLIKTRYHNLDAKMVINKGEVPIQMGKDNCVHVLYCCNFPKSELISAVYCKHVLVMEFIPALGIKRWIILKKETVSCKKLGRWALDSLAQNLTCKNI